MFFPKTAIYAVRAAAYLAGQPEGRLCGPREVAAKIHVPVDFLRKIMGEMRRRRLLRSTKGIHGGYQLTRAPRLISLWDLMQTVTPAFESDGGLLGQGGSGARPESTLSREWQRVRGEMLSFLHRTTLADFAAAVERANGRARGTGREQGPTATLR